jgi:hypothetical protein
VSVHRDLRVVREGTVSFVGSENRRGRDFLTFLEAEAGGSLLKGVVYHVKLTHHFLFCWIG